MLNRRPIVVVLVAALTLAACSSAASPSASPTAGTSPTDGAASPPAGTSRPTEPGQSPGPTAEVPEVSAECQAQSIEGLKNPPRLTLSTDNPAFPPWWGGDPEIQYPTEPEEGSGWDFADPYSMEGYESATAYAVAAALGFTADEVDWIPNTEFTQAFQPGEKPFDFHMAQVSIRARRARAVDFSDPYFQANQSLLAVVDTPITEVTTIAGLKEFRLGAAVGTTSFELIEDAIQPTVEPRVFNDNDLGRRALNNEQIDGLVVDLQTAFFMRDVQMDGRGVVVGQFDVEAQSDPVGMVLQKSSPLTACVNEALAVIQADGTLDAIYEEWISTDQQVPFFE